MQLAVGFNEDKVMFLQNTVCLCLAIVMRRKPRRYLLQDKMRWHYINLKFNHYLTFFKLSIALNRGNNCLRVLCSIRAYLSSQPPIDLNEGYHIP